MKDVCVFCRFHRLGISALCVGVVPGVGITLGEGFHLTSNSGRPTPYAFLFPSAYTTNCLHLVGCSATA